MTGLSRLIVTPDNMTGLSRLIVTPDNMCMLACKRINEAYYHNPKTRGISCHLEFLIPLRVVCPLYKSAPTHMQRMNSLISTFTMLCSNQLCHS
jgi:hypothetical protein